MSMAFSKPQFTFQAIDSTTRSATSAGWLEMSYVGKPIRAKRTKILTHEGIQYVANRVQNPNL
jgi:hypothetical protein